MPTTEVQGLLRHAIGKTLVVCASLDSNFLAKLVKDERTVDRIVQLILSCMLRDLVREKPSNKEFRRLLDEIRALRE